MPAGCHRAPLRRGRGLDGLGAIRARARRACGAPETAVPASCRPGWLRGLRCTSASCSRRARRSVIEGHGRAPAALKRGDGRPRRVPLGTSANLPPRAHLRRARGTGHHPRHRPLTASAWGGDCCAPTPLGRTFASLQCVSWPANRGCGRLHDEGGLPEPLRARHDGNAPYLMLAGTRVKQCQGARQGAGPRG